MAVTRPSLSITAVASRSDQSRFVPVSRPDYDTKPLATHPLRHYTSNHVITPHPPPRRFVKWIANDHFRPCNSLQRSPFYKDIMLSVGDWNFNLWKEASDVTGFFVRVRVRVNMLYSVLNHHTSTKPQYSSNH